MPEMLFAIRWPDGTRETCYSPSLVIKDHLAPGEAYPVADFLDRSRTALTIAGDRVRQKFGFDCPRAAGQIARLEAAGRRFIDQPDALVSVESFQE